MNGRLSLARPRRVSIAVFASSTQAVTYTATLLHPTVFWQSFGEGASGANQVGVGRISTPGSFTDHALLWRWQRYNQKLWMRS